MGQAETPRGWHIGQRIHIIGNSCSGKSSLGECLATILGIPHIDLDALNWQPNWSSLAANDPALFTQRIQEATAGESWIVSGSYSRFSQAAFWHRLDTVAWLDLPLSLLVWRVIRRTWQRWRTNELLWGTNRERFWTLFMLWKKEESLLWWIITQHNRKRRSMLSYMLNPRWQDIRFIRLVSVAEVEAFVRAAQDQAAS